MFATIGRWTLTSQFYVYGKSNFTKTGWESAKKSYYTPDILEDANLDLSGKVYLITGANAGIGREMTTYLASKKATVYMVCRNAVRAESARSEIVEATQNTKVFVLIADCCLRSDIIRVWHEFEDHCKLSHNTDQCRLDGLICNAGALPHERILTSEGVETIIAAHFIFGTYLLGKLALPLLSQTEGSRLIVVSSGGMYNTNFPVWEEAVTMTPSNQNGGFNGQMTYCVAKRGQVLLCEQWAEQFKGKVKIVSCHPGWTLTEGLDTTYGEQKKYLEPLRTLWEGSEGILWLLIAPLSEVVDGAFYLDRSPQRKHLAGLLYGEASTTNTVEEVGTMMERLELWSTNPAEGLRQSAAAVARTQPLVALSTPMTLSDFMGKWYVLANIPTVLEVGLYNCTETYCWNEVQKRVKVSFQYHASAEAARSASATPTEIKQVGNLVNPPINTHWGICPKVLGVYLPVNMGYLIVDLAEDFSYAMIGVPDRAYLWVLTRSVPSDYSAANVPVHEAYDLAGNQDNDNSCSTSGGGASADVAAVDDDQTAKVAAEKLLLRRVLAKATELGYDSTKLLRVPWINK